MPVLRYLLDDGLVLMPAQKEKALRQCRQASIMPSRTARFRGMRISYVTLLNITFPTEVYCGMNTFKALLVLVLIIPNALILPFSMENTEELHARTNN